MWHLAHVLALAVKSDNTAVVQLRDGATLKIWLNDSYWLFLLRPSATYEPEVDFVLNSQLTSNSFFIDAGANIGYWSAKAARLIGEQGRVIAIEASPPTCQRLAVNADLDGTRFEALNRAVWSISGEQLTIMTRDEEHAGATVIPEFRADAQLRSVKKEWVLSITLDSIVERLAINGDDGLVIKLDVEGAERAALAGAAGTLRSRDVLVVYEDHGGDPASVNTDYVLNMLGLHVYYVDPRTRRPARIESVADVGAIKVNPGRGYNFFATRPGSRYEAWFLGLSRQDNVPGESKRLS